MCLRVLLPLPVCQLALCGVGLWSQIFLLHLADVHRDFMVDRKRERERMREREMRMRESTRDENEREKDREKDRNERDGVQLRARV